jgi:hypothetical protein
MSAPSNRNDAAPLESECDRCISEGLARLCARLEAARIGLRDGVAVARLTVLIQQLKGVLSQEELNSTERSQ